MSTPPPSGPVTHPRAAGGGGVGQADPGLDTVLTGVVAAGLVLVAVPVTLVAVMTVCRPWPAHWDTAGLVAWHSLLGLLVAVAWLAWAACSVQVLRSVARRVHARDVSADGTYRLTEQLSARMAAAVLVLLPVSTLTAVGVVRPEAWAGAAVHAGRSETAPTTRRTMASPLGDPAGGGPEWVWLGIGLLPAALVARGVQRRHLRQRRSRPATPDPTSTGGPPTAVTTGARERPAPGPGHRSGVAGSGDGGVHRRTAGGGGATAGQAVAPQGAADPAVDPVVDTAVDPAVDPVVDTVVDTAVALDRAGRSDLLARVEEAVRGLTLAMATRPADDGGRVPTIHLLRAGPAGVDLFPQPPQSWCPDGCTPVDGGSAWRLPSAGSSGPDGGIDGVSPWLPVLLPLGDDESGTWLVALEPGSCLAVLGCGTTELVSAMQVAVGGWAWAEQLTVTADPGAAEDAADLLDPVRGSDGSGVLYLGRPVQLRQRARAACAVLTLSSADPADLTVVVDHVAATVHPLGLTLRPHLLPAARRRELDALLADGYPDPPPAGPGRTAWGVEPEPLAPPGGIGPDRSGDPRVGPGIERRIEVRLLTAEPRLDGAATELAANRSRRAVELIAYLALHRPDPVTGDRLRTRVLGTGDADAAPQTLFNTVSAARHALGTDGDHRPLLPPANGTGQYRISPSVSVDTQRAEALVAEAARRTDPGSRRELLQAALGLVEGEPLAGTIGGYSWWLSEGHGTRIANTLVDAACQLAELALAADLPLLAAWGVGRARLVEPYSEALSCVAMRAAAASGDIDRVRREWSECCRQVEELDPGGLPSARAERLFGELVRRTPVLAVQASLAAIEPAPRSTDPSAPVAS